VTARRVRSARLDEPRAAWAPDGLLLVLSANPARQVMRIETRDPDNGMSLAVQHFNEVRDAISFPATGSPRADFSDDGRFLLARLSYAAPAWVRWLTQRWPASRRVVSDAHQSAVHVWESRTGRPTITLWRKTNYALLAPDGRTLVTVEPDGALRLWDVPPRKPWRRFLGVVALQGLLVAAVIGWRYRRARANARWTA
jgi:WD40 repeat protein